MAEKIKNITTSSASIQERWLKEIAPKYFNLNDINLLNAGLFGYINETMSNALEDSLQSSSVYYSEVIPSTAVLPQSIYSYASMTDDNDYNAVPAELPITLAIRASDVIRKAVHRDGIISYKTFLIDRHSSVIIDGYRNFMFDYDIEIIVKEVKNGSTILTPVYRLDGLNERSSIHNKYIKSITMNIEGEDYLFMNLKVRQMERSRKTIMVTARDMLDTLSFEVEYSGNLSHFNVFYQESITSKPRLIEKYFMDNLQPEAKEFCFYEYLGREKLRIFFSPYSSFFKPENGTKLLIDIYTTDGENGNFTDYQGGKFLIKFDIDNPDIGHDYKGVVVDMKLSGDSTGGRNGKTLNEIKSDVLDSFTTRKGLINDNDLQIFFNKNKKDSEMTFLKKRDDVLCRLYSAFILLKNKDNTIIPSNTVDVLINEEKCLYASSDSYYMIAAGTNFESSDTSNTYRNVDLEQGLSVPNRESMGRFVVTNPYLIQINTKPLMANYYINSMFDSFYLAHKYMNYNIQHEFLVNKLNFERDSIYKKSEYYDMTFSINTTLDLEKIEGEMFPLDNDDRKRPLIVKGIVRHKGNDIATFDCYPKSINKLEKNITYRARLKTNDFIDEDSALEMTNLNSIYESSSDMSFFIPNKDVTIQILIFYNGYDDKTKEKLGHLTYLKDHCLVTIYETETNVEFVKDISGIINGYTKLQASNKPESYDIFLKSTPVIRNLYIDSTKTVKELYNNIYYHAKLLTSSLEHIENNFDLDYKFFNTYGKSKYFVIGNNVDTLNKINIKITFRIRLMISANNEIANEIRNFIQMYIENLAGGASHIYISNLIAEMKQNFKYIEFIEFRGINNYGTEHQVIENSVKEYNSLSKLEINNYVPEYVNINKVYDDITKTLIPEINLEFV